MTLAEFEVVVASADDVSECDQTWFPKWLRRYALTHPKGLTNELPVNRETVLRFSRSLLEAGAPAWQRWQAVRSLECYRDLVLKRSEPDLSSIVAKLAQMGKQERNLELHVPPTEEELERIRGKVDLTEPDLIQVMRVEDGTDLPTLQKLMGHKDIETTMSYVHVSVAFDSRLQSPVDRLAGGD